MATQRCEALTGEARESCKEAADADYETAKRQIDATYQQ